MKKNSSALLMFLIGLGSQTQVHFFGSIGISEIPIYLLAPFIFIKDFSVLKKDGFLPWLSLAMLVCMGCMVATVVNKIPFLFGLKGFATPYSIFAVGVVFHRLVRSDFLSLRWFLIGYLLSGVICVFIFQPELYTYQNGDIARGEDAVELMITHPLFWSTRISGILRLPIQGWYMNVPSLYSFTVPVITGVVAILFSDTSGRSSFAIALFAAVLIFMGQKSRIRIRAFGKRLWLFCVVGLVLAFIIKGGYSVAAGNGWLGADAKEKYEKQTTMGKSTLDILIAGRAQVFVGLSAAIDRPIVGHGPKAEDTENYYERFLSKHGDYFDYQMFVKSRANAMAKGGYFVIPAHSYIVSFWLYYGVFGLLYWCYVLFQIWKYFRKYAAVVPQWFGYLSLSLLSLIWAIFFSPYGERLTAVLPIVCILFAKSVFEKKMELPIGLELEAKRYD